MESDAPPDIVLSEQNPEGMEGIKKRHPPDAFFVSSFPMSIVPRRVMKPDCIMPLSPPPEPY